MPTVFKLKEDRYMFPNSELQEVEASKIIPMLYEEAQNFLLSHKWCEKVIRGWHSEDFSILDKLGVFLFQIEPADDIADKYTWIIVGDLPSVYLDESINTDREALECYCILMEEWSENILQVSSIEECYPVEAAPNTENAELLKRRIVFIRRELLMKES